VNFCFFRCLRHGSELDGDPEAEQDKPEPGEQAAEVITGGCEHGVAGVAVAVGQEVTAHAVVFLAMADDGLDGASAFELASDGLGDATLLVLGVNLECVLLRSVMALVSGVGENAESAAPVTASMRGSTVLSVWPS
jgi:hypothetical protein